VRQPILIFEATGHDLTRVRRRAVERGIVCAIYTRALFATRNDADNRAAVAAVVTDDLDIVGIRQHADRKDVDRVTKGLALHP
jgi:hypothetical protein